jgi:AraC-like DNA-binding protein
MTIFAPSLGALWKQLEGYGISPGPVFREQGVDPEIMFDAGARISLEQFQRLDLRAAELSGDESFGLRGAQYFRPAHLGPLGFAWLASSTLRTAFQRLSRYARVINEKLTITLEEQDHLFAVTLYAELPLLKDRIREDGQLAAVIQFCRTIAGVDFNPAKVQFRHAEPRNTAPYYELFRCPVSFSAKSTTFFVHLSAIDERLTGSNDQLAKLNEHIVVKYLAHSERNDIVNRVKAAIIDGLSTGAVTEASVAEDLHMTPRNVHRKLTQHETSFKQLLTEIRRELAQQYIQDRSKTLTEISYLLGFSEVSSFSRAFKNWTGQPPSEVRQALT